MINWELPQLYRKNQVHKARKLSSLQRKHNKKVHHIQNQGKQDIVNQRMMRINLLTIRRSKVKNRRRSEKTINIQIIDSKWGEEANTVLSEQNT